MTEVSVALSGHNVFAAVDTSLMSDIWGTISGSVLKERRCGGSCGN